MLFCKRCIDVPAANGIVSTVVPSMDVAAAQVHRLARLFCSICSLLMPHADAHVEAMALSTLPSHLEIICNRLNKMMTIMVVV